MKISVAFIAAAFCVAGVLPAFAQPVAVVRTVHGQVSIQSSGGVGSAAAGAGLSVGDRVVAGENGRAVISHVSGPCRGDFVVDAGMAATITSVVTEEACGVRIVAFDPAAGVLAPVAPAPTVAAGSVLAGESIAPVAIGGLGIAGVAGVVALSQSNTKSP